jgi:hypothetical protein
VVVVICVIYAMAERNATSLEAQSGDDIEASIAAIC